MGFLLKTASLILAPFLMIGASIGTHFAPQQDLGATEAVPVTIAFFETTLASAITDTATTFTLTSATDKDGTTLASSTYAFVIDEGSSNEEIVIADCTGTACANALRGVSARTGNTEVTALKKTHRRGASVKITDAPILPLLSRIMRGEQEVDFTPSTGGSLVTKDYVDSLALGSTTVSATLTDDGIVELSTGLQAASSTATDDSGSPLTLHTGISTSTGGTAYTIPVTDSTGTLDNNFFSSSSITQFAIWNASTTVYAATTTAHSATSTYTKPDGLKWIDIEMVGGGGGGAGKDTDDSGGIASSGGAGGYLRLRLYANELSTTTTIVAGNAGANGESQSSPTAGSNGGDSKFGTFATTTGGTGALTNESVTTGGTATGGDININGASGQGGYPSTLVISYGNYTKLGGGASVKQGVAGKDGTGYGFGGAGGCDDSSSDGTRGGYGAVIITEYF